MAGWPEDYACAIGWSAPGVRGAIAGAKIRFHFYDSPSGAAMHQYLSQAIAGHFNGRSCVEIALEKLGAGQNLSDWNADCFLYARRLACGYSLGLTCPMRGGRSW